MRRKYYQLIRKVKYINGKLTIYLNTNNLLLFILIILIIPIVSCVKSREKILEEKRIEKEKLINTLSKDYNASIFPDSILYPSTYYYQNLFTKNPTFIINDFFLDDIEKTDSTYLITIHFGWVEYEYFELHCSEMVIKKIFTTSQKMNSTSNMFENNNTFLIVKLFSVKKIKFSVDATYENDSGDISAYVDMAPSNSHIFKGEIFDVYIDK